MRLAGVWERLREVLGGTPRLGPLESRLLDVVWHARGPLTVREVREACGGGPAYTTVMTTLDRLFKKGLLERCRRGRAFVYGRRAGGEDLQRRLACDLLRGLLAAGGDAEPVLSALVEGVGGRDREVLGELERLVQLKRRELARAGGARPGGRERR